MSLLFLLPLLSGLWSHDKKEWLDIIRIKLPLLFMPLAFAGHFIFSKKQWQSLGVIFIAIITAGTLWSFNQYLSDMANVNAGYLQAKTMITPLNNDHVRFSWLVAVAIMGSSWLFWRNRRNSIKVWLIGFLIIWLVVFLHILAVRTGLISFYITMFVLTGYIIFKKAKLMRGLAFLGMIIALPAAAYFLLPTFRNKLRYFIYDYEYFKDAHYLAGGNDASRIISLKAGWNVMTDHPVTGTGFGDIFSATEKWYNHKYPEMIQSDKILPSSEWLMYGAGCGIPGFLVFMYVMVIPFLLNMRYKLLWWLLNLIVAAGFLFDIGLEVQFGVFIYSFIVLLCWKWSVGEPLKS